jgi:serine phosphatase RsbU (regulator of sigma subunit)
MDDYVVHDEHGELLTMSDVPSVRLLAGAEAESLLMHSVHRQTGAAHWQRLKTAALRDADGQIAAAVTVIEDITAVKTAEVHTRVLANSARILASSLDYEQTLDNAARGAVPDLADWCAVELIDAELRRQTVVVAHRDPERKALVQQLRGFEPEQVRPDSTTARVFRSGQAELFFEVPDEHLVANAQSDQHLQALRALGTRSAVVVPMRVGNRTIGVMALGTGESLRRLTRDDIALAEQLGGRAAVAVENSRLHTQLNHVAQTLQHSLLPRELPDVPGWELASLYRPAGAELPVEIGGDFYEVFTAGSSSFALIGDVTGHGVTAATLTSMMRYGARFASRLEPQPAAILRRLDEELRGRAESALCTALCLRMEPGSAVLCSAGHPPALIVDASGSVTEAPEAGPLLGAFEDADWHQRSVPMDSSRLVLLYTDGVIENAGARDRFGLERLRELLARNAGASPAELLRVLDEELTAFRGGAPNDDIAALALRPRR